MYIYTHRRWNKGSVLYTPNHKRVMRPLTQKQQKPFLNDGRVKLFLKFLSKNWYKADNLFYGPHTWILKNPNKLPKIPQSLISFAEYYYEKTYEMLKKAKTEKDKYPEDEYVHPKGKKSRDNLEIYNKEKISYYMYGQTSYKRSPSEFIDVSWDRDELSRYLNLNGEYYEEDTEINTYAGMWEDEYFVDAVQHEFGAVGFRVGRGAVVTIPDDVEMEYYYDYDTKEFNDREKYYNFYTFYNSEYPYYKTHNKYDTLIHEPEYQNRKIEDQNLLNTLKKISHTEDDEDDYV